MSKKEYTGHPDARRPSGHIMPWVHLALLIVIVIALNFIGCREYGRRDLSNDERYTISQRTVNVLTSRRVQERDTPITIIFAFKRSTPGYARMRHLLEEYERVGNGKVRVECFDPIREPNRAREISRIYNVDFNQNLCVVDARKNPNVALNTFEKEQSNNERKHVRIRPGTSFVRYESVLDKVRGEEIRRPVALMMDDVVCGALTEAVEGDLRRMYVVDGKGGISRDNPDLLETIGNITNSLNIQLTWANIADVDSLPEDAEGVIVIGPQVDFTEAEVNVLREFWERSGRKSIFVALDPAHTDLPLFYRFLREQGIHPNRDRVLLRDRSRAYYDISAVFPKGLQCTRVFWNTTTHVEGECMSLRLEHWDENLANLRHLTLYPLIKTTAEYYGETRADLKPVFDKREDHEGPLCIEAAVTRGNAKDPNNLNTLVVLGNISTLEKDNIRSEQRDYLSSIFAWMSNRPEYAGKSAKVDLTTKIDLNRHTQSALEHITLWIMPLLALLIALVIWNTRRH